MTGKANGNSEKKSYVAPEVKQLLPSEILEKYVRLYEARTGAAAAHTRLIDFINWLKWIDKGES